MKKLRNLWFVLFTAVFLLNACGGGTGGPTSTVSISSSPTPAGLRDSVQVGMLDEITSNNVWAILDQGGSTYWNQLVQANNYPALYALTSVGDNLIPVAASGQPSEFTKEGDFYIATIVLKNNLLWSDNYPVTAYDVSFTINTVLKFRLGFNWQSYYDASILDHAEALDNVTLKYFFTQQPGFAKWKYGALLGIIVSRNFWAPKIAQALELLGDGTDATARSTAVSALEKLSVSGEPVFGIYQMNNWQPGVSYVNTANPNSFYSHLVVIQYTDGSYEESKPENGYDWKFENISGTATYKLISYTTGPYFNRVTFTAGDSDTSYMNLRNGNLNLVMNPFGLPLAVTGQLEADSSIKTTSLSNSALTILAFNQNRSVFAGDAGTLVRTTIACMINQDDLTNSLLQNQGVASKSLVPTDNTDWTNPNVTLVCNGLSDGNRLLRAAQYISSRGYDWSIQYPVFNPSSAQESQIVSGKGLHDLAGNPFPVLTLLAPSASTNPLGATAADYIARQLEKLGMTVTVITQNIGDRLSSISSGNYDLAVYSIGLPHFPNFICSIFDNGFATNPFGYASANLVQQCSSFAQETDPAQLKSLAFSLQTTLATELPVVPLFSNSMIQTYRTADFPFVTGASGPDVLYEPHSFTQLISIQ
jgi:ABC-type transport system substrate-binding protein